MASGLSAAGMRSRGMEFGNRFSVRHKIVGAAAVVTLLVGGYIFLSWASKPTYTTLFSSLTPEDASLITEKLSSQGVTYQLADGGTRVLVPQSDVYQTRIDLSAQGLPSGGNVGYSLLDKQGITTSEFNQRVDYQRALQGELAKTIQSIDGVSGATVNLVIPKDDLFTNDNKKPTASVLLTVQPGREVTEDQARTIVHLVSSSVEGLQPSDVTVADQTGRILSNDVENNAAAGSTSNARAEAAVEQQLSDAIEELLTPVTGIGKAVVNVNADLDFDTRSTQTERFDANGTSPVQSETTNTETLTGTGTDAGGVLGDTTNIAASGDTNYAKTETSRTFMNGKVTEIVGAAPGKVQRMNVAVLLDSNLENIDRTAIERLVSRSIGFDATRGDQVSVEAMPFDTRTAEEAEKALAAQEAATSRAQLFDMIRNGLILLVVIIGLIMVWRTTKKALVQSTGGRGPLMLGEGGESDPMAIFDPAQLQAAGIGKSFDLRTVAELAKVSGSAGAMPSVAPEALERQHRANEVSALIDRQPTEVAALLRNWLSERRG
jgi:flagellar M-ring protein FliF